MSLFGPGMGSAYTSYITHFKTTYYATLDSYFSHYRDHCRNLWLFRHCCRGRFHSEGPVFHFYRAFSRVFDIGKKKPCMTGCGKSVLKTSGYTSCAIAGVEYKRAFFFGSEIVNFLSDPKLVFYVY